MVEMHHLVRNRISMASEKRKTRYYVKATGHDFHEGDKICRNTSFVWRIKIDAPEQDGNFNCRPDIRNLVQGNCNNDSRHRFTDELRYQSSEKLEARQSDAFVLQDDNARLHMARVVDAYTEQETIQRMQRPDLSLDRNPMT
ncbi:hypothetical protein TNCV_147361 [Trichonephila clavipes]|nr:hypothetical protein TNCV_147361 [Trichonephila clavipes]